MKHLLTLMASLHLGFGGIAQSSYLTVSRKEAVRLLNERDIDIYEHDSDHIHSVDGNGLRNIILYFTEDACMRVVTTFQRKEDFERVVAFMNRNCEWIDELCWKVKVEGGIDSIVAWRKTGYDMIEENFVSVTEQ